MATEAPQQKSSLVLEDIGVTDLRRVERRLEDTFVHMLKQQDK